MKESMVAGGVVINSQGEVVIVNNRGRSWSLPKGHVDAGEDPLAAAKREIYEETGIKEVKFLRSLGKYDRQRTSIAGGDDLSELKHMEIFLFESDQKELQPLDPKNPEARWVKKDKVEELLTHVKDKEFFAKIKDSI